MSKVNPCMFMSKTVIYVVYVDYCLFLSHSQSDRDSIIIIFNGDGPRYTFGDTQKESQCLSY